MPFTVLGPWNESKQAVSAITYIDTKYPSWDSPKDNLETTLRCKFSQQINCLNQNKNLRNLTTKKYFDGEDGFPFDAACRRGTTWYSTWKTQCAASPLVSNFVSGAKPITDTGKIKTSKYIRKKSSNACRKGKWQSWKSLLTKGDSLAANWSSFSITSGKGLGIWGNLPVQWVAVLKNFCRNNFRVSVKSNQLRTGLTKFKKL